MFSRYGKFKDKWRTEPQGVLTNMKRSMNGYMYGNLNMHMKMEFKYMRKIRWNVLVFNTTVSFTADDKWEEKRDEMNLGPETAYSDVTISWAGNLVTAEHISTPMDTVTVPAATGITLDMEASVAGSDFLIQVQGYEQYGMMASYSVFDDGTYVPPTVKKVSSDEGWSKSAVTGVSVVMCLVAVALFALIFVVRKQKNVQYTRTLDESSTVVFNPALALEGDSSHGKDAPKCAWCGQPHSAQDCKQMIEFANKRSMAIEGRVSTKANKTELMHLDNL
jgi:hypothetical protein